MQERWVNLNGLKIRYLDSGKDHNHHVLFIHGLGSSADRWGVIPNNLSTNFHTIVIDLPGFGKSDKPTTMDYTIKNFRDIVIDFMNLLSIGGGKISIVGHSLGGFIAVEVAIKNKIKLEKLVLIDTSGMLEKPTSLLEEYLNASMNPTKDKVRKVFEQMVAVPTRIPSQLVEDFITRINLPGAKHAFKSTLQNSVTTQVGIERLKLIDNLSTLIIWGIKDNVIPIEHSELFQKYVTNSRVEIILDAGHAPFAEKPKQVFKLINNFLT